MPAAAALAGADGTVELDDGAAGGFALLPHAASASIDTTSTMSEWQPCRQFRWSAASDSTFCHIWVLQDLRDIVELSGDSPVVAV